MRVLELGEYWWQERVEHGGNIWTSNGYTPGDAVSQLWGFLLRRYDRATPAERQLLDDLPNASTGDGL